MDGDCDIDLAVIDWQVCCGSTVVGIVVITDGCIMKLKHYVNSVGIILGYIAVGFMTGPVGCVMVFPWAVWFSIQSINTSILPD